MIVFFLSLSLPLSPSSSHGLLDDPCDSGTILLEAMVLRELNDDKSLSVLPRHGKNTRRDVSLSRDDRDAPTRAGRKRNERNIHNEARDPSSAARPRKCQMTRMPSLATVAAAATGAATAVARVGV